MNPKMNRSLKLAAVAATAALALTACADTGRDCDPAPVLIYVNGQYHYNSPTGKLVPATKVPSGARKVPGYKPYNPPKVNAPAPKAPSFRKR